MFKRKGCQATDGNCLPIKTDHRLAALWRRGVATIGLSVSLLGGAQAVLPLSAQPLVRSDLEPVVAPATRVIPIGEAGDPQIAARSLESLESRVIKGVNRIRRKKGLTPLRYNPTLVGVARRHSHNMLVNWFFSHSDQYGHTVLERVQKTGLPLRLVAENLAWTSNAPDPVETAIQSWVDSPGHLENILEPRLRETGVGIARRGEEYFFTQVFILKR